MKAELIQYGCEFELEVRAKKLVILTQSFQRISERWAGAQERVFEARRSRRLPGARGSLSVPANSRGCSMFTRRAFSAFVMAAILLAASSASQAQNPALKERFEKQVQEYEAGDRNNPPPRTPSCSRAIRSFSAGRRSTKTWRGTPSSTAESIHSSFPT
jgi:hypothetical protein